MKKAPPFVFLIVISLAAGPARAETPPAPQVHGYVQASAAISTAGDAGTIPNRPFGAQDRGFSVDAAQLSLERAPSADGTVAGFSLRALLGTSATPLHAVGLDLGPQADLYQAAVTLLVPTSRGPVRFTLGRQTTLLGQEVIESVANANVSLGSQCAYLEPYTDTGLDVQWEPSSRLLLQARVVNGWDVVRDPNRAKTAFGRVRVNPDAVTTVALAGFAGAEQPGNDADMRYGGELLASRTMGPHAFTVQLDAGYEEGLAARWSGAGVWATVALGERAALALRLDAIDDPQGARTSGAAGIGAHAGSWLGSATATLHWKPVPGLLVRPEVRWDRAEHSILAGDDAQTSFALDAALVY